MKHPLKDDLASLGLSDKEASIYLALLEVGTGPVSQIAKRAKISRTNVYSILSRLQEKHLISPSREKPRQEWSANSPELLTLFLEEKVQKNKDRLTVAKKIIPELKTITNSDTKPKVKFYEGISGLEEVCNQTLESSEEMLAMVPFENLESTLPNYFPEYFKKRAARGIKIKTISPLNIESEKRHVKDQEELRESILIPSDEYNFPSEIDVYDNKVIILSWKEKLSIVIESAQIAKTVKQMYKLAWLGAKSINNKN